MTVDLDAAKEAFLAGRLEAAEVQMRAALAEQPAIAANDLGGLCVHAGRTEEGVRWLLKALERAPGWALPRYNLGLALLSSGLSELGWMLLEARRGVAELNTPAPDLPIPEWRGEPLAGRSILVIGEQGAGDQIMFARYLAVLRTRGARVSFLCYESLADLLPDGVAGVSRRTDADAWVLAMSLPRLLGPALRVPPPVAIPIAAGSGGGVGIMAAGSRTHANDRNRSLRGAEAERLLAMGRDLSEAATGAKSFRETAEIISGLDLVISVDTAVAHLAASMGKPTWILIPALGTDWRWGRTGEATPWYPAARLYRQSTPGDWSGVLDEVARDLAAREVS